MLQLRRQRWSLVTNRTYDLDSNKEANEVLEEHDDFDFYLLKQEEDAQKGLSKEKGFLLILLTSLPATQTMN